MKYRAHRSRPFIIPRGTYFSWLLALCFSCNIIADSDIETQAELQNLKLSSIDIVQSSSPNSKSILSLTYDSTVNRIVDSARNLRITRKVGFSAAMSEQVLFKFHSGVKNNVRIVATYLSVEKPYNFFVISGDSLTEVYRFRYDDSGRLNKIVTILDPIDGAPALAATNDTLIYDDSGSISNIERRSSDPEKELSMQQFLYGVWGNNTQTLSGFQVYQNSNQIGSASQYQGNCPDNSDQRTCTSFGFNYFNGQNNNSNPSVTINSQEVFNKVNQLKFISQCCRDEDTFYFHPLMLLKNEIKKGDILFYVYMMDWWAPGSNNSTGGGENKGNRSLSLNFNYGL
jgi:hypothetical protein